MTTTHPARNGLGIAAISLGLVGLLFSIVPLTGFIAVMLGIVGLILGFAARGRLKRSEATNGKTTVAGIVASLAAVAIGIYGITVVFGAVDQFDQDMQEISNDFDRDMQEISNDLDATMEN